MATLKNTPLTSHDPCLTVRAPAGSSDAHKLEVARLLLADREMARRDGVKAGELLSMYWDPTGVAQEVKIDRWIAENQPLTPRILLMLIEAAGTKALNLGYSQNTKKAAAAPRPKKGQFRDAVRAAMRPSKRSDMTFDAFMAHWSSGSIKGLSLKPDATTESLPLAKTRHIVTDENGALKPRSYTWGTLNKIWST